MSFKHEWPASSKPEEAENRRYLAQDDETFGGVERCDAHHDGLGESESGKAAHEKLEEPVEPLVIHSLIAIWIEVEDDVEWYGVRVELIVEESLY